MIYVFSINDTAHMGLVKIGDATLYTDKIPENLPPNCTDLNQSALKRIKSYTNTAGYTPKILHTELAVRKVNNKTEAFRDTAVHDVLKNSNFNNVKIGESTGKEWFRIDVDIAKKAIEAVKKGYANLSNSGEMSPKTIILRPEQEECIDKVLNHFKHYNRFLINAKMRFGKTLVSLEIVKRSQFKKTIILTHRPVVDDGWYDDFTKIFAGSGYIYGSKSKGYTLDVLMEKGENFIYFASIQDLRGSSKAGGKFKKNDSVFQTIWDCVIVDEAHEGTTTSLGENTVAEVVKEKRNKTKFLALSGTPFNILPNYDENAIYTWDYIMEQKAKAEWDRYNFGDSNPYDVLPFMNFRLYSLQEIMKNEPSSVKEKSFNFTEFFRTWTSDIKIDNTPMPSSAKIGDFVHETDIVSFLNLMTKDDARNCYPYTNIKYRALFKHSLWLLPGVKEAKALKELLKVHPVFGSNAFTIVNVAGNEETADPLAAVREAISKSSDGYTITLSCGKLTTGVTVKEWTAVFMLAGSYSTSAANYLQTIFRVQSPCSMDGKIKENAYVFDFAPDRSLKIVASTANANHKSGKSKIGTVDQVGRLMNYTSIIAVSGSEMTKYDANKLLQEVKKIYAERVVQHGFDDSNLYCNDELMKLADVDITQFEKLQKIIGKTEAMPKTDSIDINAQGMDDEEHEKLEKKKRKKEPLTPEEKKRLEELKKIKKNKETAISILRGISIRMPLLIYGADIPYDEEITLEKFVDLVDNASWKEFMPKGVTKSIFKRFQKYYDAEVFIAAGRKIRTVAREADYLEPTERVKKIAGLFSYFKNPDKETVLTPWRVVNMHMGDCIGGWNFWNENFTETIDEPRFVEQDKVTFDIFSSAKSKILEINSKTGLYPLYVTYSLYRDRCSGYKAGELTEDTKKKLWQQTVTDNVFVICKTPMARAITRRTLLGYGEGKINAHAFDDLVNMMENKPQQFINKITNGKFWGKIGKMEFNAIVGNPPYQEETGGAGRQARPVYNIFMQNAKNISDRYVSMIMPSRWFAGGMNLDDFRENMLSDNKLSKVIDYTNAKDLFPQISISGGICYCLWDKKYFGDCEFTNVKNGNKSKTTRPLNEFSVLIRYNEAVSIIHKIVNDEKFKCIDEIVSPLMPFGLPTNYRGRREEDSEDNIRLYSSNDITYIKKEEIKKGLDYLNKYKIMMSKMSAEHAGEPSKDGRFRVFTNTMRVLHPNEACTHSYFLIGASETKENIENLYSYLRTNFVRFLVLIALSAVNLSKLVFIFVPTQNFSESWTDEKLYAKYGLTDDEIKFIESMIKPME